MKLVVINGPNLNLTGMRSPNVYGTDTLETITEELNGYVISCGSNLQRSNPITRVISSMQYMPQ